MLVILGLPRGQGYPSAVNLFSELKRRGVVQTAVAYTVTAWLLVQVADAILPAFEAPEWGMRALIILLAIGLPVTLLCSWLFDLTHKGFVRTVDGEDQPAPMIGSGTANVIIIGVLVAAVILFSLDKFVWQSELLPNPSGRAQSVAVLPFQNLSSDPANDAFAKGIHDDLLTQLSKIKSFSTLSRTSTLGYAGSTKAIPVIAGELGASVILEGGVQRSNDRIRINAQLIDGQSDTHLWAETYDRQLSMENIFAIQSEISRAIAAALEATLSTDERRQLELMPTQSLQAYDAYAAGLAGLDAAGMDDLEQAVASFERAIKLDPDFASGWAGLCKAQLSRYRKSSDPEQFQLAERACQRALELDAGLVEVHIALGTLYRFFGEYARAEDELQKANYAKAEQALANALDLNSVTVEAIVELGNVLARQNRLVEAEAELQRAQSLSPRNYDVLSALFSFYYVYSDRVDRFELAAAYGERMTSLRPDLPAAWNNLGTAKFMLDRYEDAALAWTESMRLNPTRTAYTNTGLALFYAARYAESAQMQREAITLAPNDHRVWGRLGDALRFMPGNESEAIAAYARAAELAGASLQVNPMDWQARGLLGVYLVHSGDEQGAKRAIEAALQASSQRSEARFYAALVAIVLGDEATALQLLERLVEQDRNYAHLVANEPDFFGLHTDEQFKQIISGEAAQDD